MHDTRLLVQETSPFLRRVGVQVEEASPAEVRLHLPLNPDNLGSSGQLHAGAIFTLATAAATVLAQLAFDPTQFSIIDKTGDVRFRRPARGDLWARAQLSHQVLEATLERGRTEGRVDVAVPVSLSDQAGERVADATVTLSLRRL
ncbi:MAG: YiiD C-terminal domain-containing protein [Myxococcales bacterium]|nr:DUF4442 domain-containing protein [Myxococcota bacterium]MDW8281702.1 YiiD C-terminal domain-containing protein [Myxococcales bacterium]